MAYRYDKNPISKQKQIIIDGWENGMANSPEDGIADMRNVITDIIPGVAMCNYNLVAASASGSSTFTVDTSGNSLGNFPNGINLNIANGTAFTVTTTGTLPAPLAAATTYYIGIYTQNALNYSFAVYSDAALASRVIMTTTGTGVQTLLVTTPGAMTEYAVNPLTGYIYIGDSLGRIWSNETPMSFSTLNRVIDFSLIKEFGTAGAGSTANAITGMSIFKNYLVAAMSTILSFYGPLTTAVSGRSWQNLTVNSALSGAGQHLKYFQSNQYLYFCNGVLGANDYQIGSINQLDGTTFNPGDINTYNLNRKALLLPETEIASWLEEQGGFLMIGTSTSNYIYPWDRFSVLFETPIILPEAVTQKMININRVLYIFCGFRGNIYYTLGTTAQLLLTFPRVNMTSTAITETILWGGVMSQGDHLVFGAQGGSTEYSGVYQVNLNTGALVNPITGSIVMLNQNSNGTTASNTVLIPYTSPRVLQGNSNLLNLQYSYSNGIQYICGWVNTAGTVGGIDKLAFPTADNPNTAPSFYSNYETFVVSDLIPMGSAIEPITITQVEAKLDSPLVSGEKFRVSMRSNLNTSFTTLFEQTAVGAVDGLSTTISVQNMKWIQLKCEMQSVSGGSFVRLKQLMIQF